uniref:C2H2-type domain-containing protein n=1 Tax=Gouania willdenowi TaxID=441366 RepID=A0A8C5E7U1_GOUWI
MNSETEKRPAYYSCSKCELEFKKALHLNRHMKCHAEPSKISHDSFVCRECGESFQQSNALIEHMSTHREQNPRLKEETISTKDEKEMEKNAIFYCPQCSFGADSPNSFVQHAKTHEKDKKKYSCDKCSFKALSEKDLRRHEIMQHTVITNINQIPYDRSDSFSCNICTYKTYNKTVFTNHLLRRHQQTFKDYNCDLLGNKNAQPTGKGSDDGKFTSKILINNQIASKTTCLPNETSGISDLFKNSKMKRSPKSQLTESKLDKSINVLLSRQRLGKKAAELMECNNSKLSDLHSKADEDGCNELPDITIVKTKDSLNHRSPNGPRFNAETSGNKKSSSKRKMSTPYHNTSDQESSFNFLEPLQSSEMVDQEEEDELENDIFQFDDTDSNSTAFDNNIRKEKQNIIYTYSRRMPMREALQASKRLFKKMKSGDQTDNDSEIKEECIETEVFQDTFEPHQIPLGESFSDDFSEFDSEHNCPYCPAIFESGVGLSNHVRGHLYRVGLAYNARHVVPPEQVACQDRRTSRGRWSPSGRLACKSDSETVRTSIHSCPLCGDSFDNRTGQSNHIRGHLKKIGRNFASKSKPPLVLLRELMRDKREFQRAMQIIGKRRNHYHYGTSPKRPAVDRLTPPPTDILQSGSFPSLCTDAKPPMPSFSVGELESKELEAKSDIKDSLAGTTALIGILKKRKCQEDARLKTSPPIARNTQSLVPPNTEDSASRVASSLPNSISG